MENKLIVLFCSARAPSAPVACSSSSVRRSNWHLDRLAESRNVRASTAESQGICDGVPKRIDVQVQTKTGLQVCRTNESLTNFEPQQLPKWIPCVPPRTTHIDAQNSDKNRTPSVSTNDNITNDEITRFAKVKEGQSDVYCEKRVHTNLTAFAGHDGTLLENSFNTIAFRRASLCTPTNGCCSRQQPPTSSRWLHLAVSTRRNLCLEQYTGNRRGEGESQWPSNRTRHISSKVGKLDVRNGLWQGNQPTGDDPEFNHCCPGPMFSGGFNINCELLHEAVCGHFQSTHRQRESRSKAIANNSHRYDRINTLEHHLLDRVMVDIAAGRYHPFESTRQKTCLHV